MASNVEILDDNKRKGIASELKNKVQFIKGNSQILHEIWKDSYEIFKNCIKNKDIRLAGLSLEDVNDIVPRILNGNIEGSAKISQIANHLDDSSDVRNKSENGNCFPPEKRYRLIAGWESRGVIRGVQSRGQGLKKNGCPENIKQQQFKLPI